MCLYLFEKYTWTIVFYPFDRIANNLIGSTAFFEVCVINCNYPSLPNPKI